MTRRRSQPRVRRSARFGDAEWQMVEVVAAAADVPPSTWLREAAVAQARRELSRLARAEPSRADR
jgi:hypothetical protein